MKDESSLRIQIFPTRALCSAFMLIALPNTALVATAQDNIGGHIGFVLPLVTHAGGNTTTIADNFSIGFPVGVTFKGKGSMAFDLEFVPGVQDSPRNTSLTVHPGFVWSLGHGWAAGIRAAFDVNTPSFGFTPLVNHSWPIKDSFFKAYFVEAVLPVRFNRPTGGPDTTPVTFGLHFGLAF